MRKVPAGFNKLVDQRGHEAAEFVRHFVVPMFSGNVDGAPEFEATGTLVRLNGRHLLISAAHVFDELHDGVHLLIEG